VFGRNREEEEIDTLIFEEEKSFFFKQKSPNVPSSFSSKENLGKKPF